MGFDDYVIATREQHSVWEYVELSDRKLDMAIEWQNELSSSRSLKMKRYRAVYKFDHEHKAAVVYAIGYRINIYETVSSLKQP